MLFILLDGANTNGPDTLFRKKGDQIFSKGDAADYVYQVVSGMVQRYASLPDGRRQISSFHLPGDFFGLESGDVHRFTTEALVDTWLRLVARKDLEALAEGDPVLLRDLIKTTTSVLNHAENHLLLLGRKFSEEKVAAFLLEMDARLAKTGILSLPMSRRDIADYLGLTLETVSRALAKLEKAGAIQFLGTSQREIAIRDRKRLARFDSPS